MAGRHLGRGHRACGLGVQADPGDLRPRLGRRHHVVALHQRGELPRAEARPRGLRQQQRRHLRPGLPLADRLRPEGDGRHLGRHAGFRLRGRGGRHFRDRRQPHRWAPGVRFAHEAAAARRREAHRGRPTAHRHREIAARPGRLPPAAEARRQCRDHQRHSACGGDRGDDRRDLCPHALRDRRFRGLGPLRGRYAPLAGGHGRPDRRTSGGRQGRGPPLRHRRQGRDLLRSRRHRAQPRLDHGDGHGQPRHGDRQHRACGRRREPAARPEQRAGLLRHGLVPA